MECDDRVRSKQSWPNNKDTTATISQYKDNMKQNEPSGQDKLNTAPLEETDSFTNLVSIITKK